MGRVYTIANMWMHKEQYEYLKEWEEERQRMLKDFLQYGILPPEREPKEDDNVKLAYVVIKGKRQMVGMHNETMKAFELREDVPHWKLPLVPIEYDKFERWCTSFDT